MFLVHTASEHHPAVHQGVDRGHAQEVQAAQVWIWHQRYVNPILTGLFESKFFTGGGGGVNLTPLQISAPKGPIAAKFCMDVKTQVKSIATTFFWLKTFYLLCYYDLCKLDAQLSHIY